ncbi:uncharacterized protein LOC129768893 isoform X1 [Toxorhynchites rutilus septentrionalis]|uniref:uncharacterized protein LOC129768893 isoform X1 n=1 Tax=Toxorhynchites rutilus septentrionalis TaxID=329112 RepID=UPI002479EE0A|nr:uncharacterized protein LOC129768893 isoform X1 [Toxorhynchites rutilus septentrionalis]
MNRKTLVAIVLALTQIASITAAPQFLTFKDGKIGVNFGGYHAEAGLGGLLTGNAAHGGLSASAGTPFGQQAGAGLGGLLDGNARSAGGAYAGASAGHGVGASAAIGGSLDDAGGAGGTGAEAHAPGVHKKVVKLGQTNGAAPPSETILVSEVSPQHHPVNTKKHVIKEIHTDLETPLQADQPDHTVTKTVYKKKFVSHPHKVTVVESSIGSSPNNIDLNRFFDFQAFTNIAAGYSNSTPQKPSSTILIENDNHQIQKKVHVKTRFDSNGHTGGSTITSTSSGATIGPNFWNDIFNIPISTLTAVNQFLNNKSGSGNLQVRKHVEAH